MPAIAVLQATYALKLKPANRTWHPLAKKHLARTPMDGAGSCALVIKLFCFL